MSSAVLLSRHPDLYSTRRLRAALEERWVPVRILHPERCVAVLQEGKAILYYEEELLTPPTWVIPRIGAPLTALGARLLLHFQQMGSLCLNPGKALALARDKFLSLQILAAAGLPVPDTWYLADGSGLRGALEQLGVPLVSKLLAGSQGIGVNLIESPSAARGLADTLLHLQHELILQRYLPGRTDLRLLVLYGQVIAAMERRAGSNEFRSNLHCGGSARALDPGQLDPRLREWAIAACVALDLDFAGVDLMADGKGGYVILEVNPVPSLEGIEGVTGLDLAGQIVAALMKQASSAVPQQSSRVPVS